MTVKDKRSITEVIGQQGSFVRTSVVASWDRSLDSVSNSNWRRKIRAGIPVGGPFETIKNETFWSLSPEVTVYPRTGSGNEPPTYVGKLRTLVAPPNAPSQLLNLDAWGPEAYSRLKPTNPSFAGLNSLYELKDLPGMLRLRLKNGLVKGSSDSYLNGAFGWAPLLNDIRRLVELQQKIQRRLEWLKRNNGKPIRREVTLLEDTTTTGPTIYGTPSHGHFWPIIGSANWAGNQYAYLSSVTYTKIWASARFRYWLPPGPRDIEWDRNMLRRLYGISVTPSVVYNMIPWSWLIDWFTNLGDIIANLDSGVADRLAADYLYLMGTVERISRLDVTGNLYLDRTSGPMAISASTTNTFKHKKRIKGDPFGFNTNPSSLTVWQLSILGALGLSRLR